MYLLGRVGRKDGYRRKVGAVEGGREGGRVKRTSLLEHRYVNTSAQYSVLQAMTFDGSFGAQHTTLLSSIGVRVKSCNVP